MKRREFVRSVGLASLAGPLGRYRSLLGKTPSSPPPNIVFIMADDHASQAVGCYGGRLNRTPHIDRIAREGARFDRCFCTNGICAPSRAAILTGRYGHLNGVRDNARVFDGSQATFPKLLQAAGYETALLGKWHLESDPTGFDHWCVLPGQGDYYNPDLIEMGAKTRRPGYVTDILTDLAVDFIEARKSSPRPFLLMLHHKAPHRNWQPAIRHMALYDDAEIPEPPTLFDDYATRSRAAAEQEMTIRDHMTLESDLKLGPPPGRMDEDQKKAWEAVYGPKREAFRKAGLSGDALVRWKYRRYLQDYLGCVAAVDESVGRVLDGLDRTGLASRTLVIYTSDQGFFLGEHGWFDKRFMYEEALRMPLVMRLPGRIPAGSVRDEMLTNVDLAPTCLDAAGIKRPAAMQGRSFLPLAEARPVSGWPRSIFYHYCEYPAEHMVKRHYGVRTERYKLIRFYYDIDAWELYDLERDPRELRNVYADPAYTGVRRDLASELLRLQKLYGDSEELALHFVKADLKK
ncbi:MAG TPA: sulfatase [Candidatus Aminicenantes bacterium]|nr:sulfatase [Candidatus Aminicenantes bacterium]HRY64573.1 sulfatase [Candidatus Aminicenantes bacterium]HRZ71486.1 sulfatase [Candidatus Aminicenantes bacterium]